MAVLVVGSRRNPKIVRLDSRSITVGRAEENRIALDHPDVSRLHCRIEFVGDELYRVVDLGSTNGTYLNGEPISSMVLEVGDRIIVGQNTLIFATNSEDIEVGAEASEDVFPWKPTASGNFSAVKPRGALKRQETRDPPTRVDRDSTVRRKVTHRPTARLNLRDILPQLTGRGHYVGSEMDLSNLLLLMLSEILRCTAFERAILLLHDERTGLVQPVLCENVDYEELSPEVQKLIGRLTKQCIDDQQPVFCCGSVLDFDELSPQFPQDPEIDSALCIPLTVPKRRINRERRRSQRTARALGAFYLDSSQTIEELSEEEQQNLEIVAAQACMALQNAQLHYQATTDPMTRLNNRVEMWQVLRDELEWSRDTESSLGIILLDLDHFKRVNDTHGHPAGDEVLKRLARRITRVLRADDHAFRWGGEEFLILVPNTRLDAVLNVTSKIAHTVSASPIGERRLRVTVSMGVALYPDHGMDAEVLIQHADIALYEAKASGRDRTRIYDPKMEHGIHAHNSSHWSDPSSHHV